MKAIFIAAERDVYSIKQADHAITVAGLIDILSTFDPAAKVYTCQDGGYTYGAVKSRRIWEREIEEEDY